MVNKKSHITWLFLMFIVFLALSLPASAQETEPDEPVVQAVLFYSPTCPHCHEVITNFLLPLLDEYGPQLEVLGIDTSTESGSYLYDSAITAFQIPQDRLGVPTLIVADTILVGSYEIPQLFPAILEGGLESGGIGWSEIPGLAEIVADLPPTEDSPLPATEQTSPAPAVPETFDATQVAVEGTAVATNTPTPTPTSAAPIMSLSDIDSTQIDTATTPTPPADPLGFAVGWIVWLLLIGGLLFCIWQIVRSWPLNVKAYALKKQWRWFMWVLILIGLVVSAYLAYVETMHVTAVCGPVGECNIVQSSPYATILGIPIALFGLLFYLVVGLLLWLSSADGPNGRMAARGLVALTLFGMLFSIYLTSLELLVIQAVCMWCLTSALVTGVMFLLVTLTFTQRPLTVEAAHGHA